MTTKYSKRNCNVCEKEFTVVLDFIGTLRIQSISSNEGVMFKFNNSGYFWFCNECWNQIIEYTNKKLHRTNK